MLGCWDVGMGTLERVVNSTIGSERLEIRFPINDAGFFTVLWNCFQENLHEELQKAASVIFKLNRKATFAAEDFIFDAHHDDREAIFHTTAKLAVPPTCKELAVYFWASNLN